MSFNHKPFHKLPKVDQKLWNLAMFRCTAIQEAVAIITPINEEEAITIPTQGTTIEDINRINLGVEARPDMDQDTEVNPPTTRKEGKKRTLRVSHPTLFRQLPKMNADVATRRGIGLGIAPRSPGNQTIEEAIGSLITTLEGIPMLLEKKKNMMQMTLRKIQKTNYLGCRTQYRKSTLHPTPAYCYIHL